MKSNFQNLILVCFFVWAISILGGCSSETSNVSDVEIIDLKEYETIYRFEENTFSSRVLLEPTIIKYGGESNLFVYDRRRQMVVEVDISGSVINDYGRVGKGPGEFRYINSITLNKEHLYLVDHWQFLIHKYNRDGEFVSSMNYGSYTKGGQSMLNLLSSIVPEGIQAMDINNRPFVLPTEHVLLSPGRNNIEKTLYELRDWDGNYLTGIGDIPVGSQYLPENSGETYLNAIENREIPGFFKRRAFPVSDKAISNELFLIFSATARIAKYNTNGTKLWDRAIEPTPETDAISNDFFRSMTKQNEPGNQRHPGINIGMLKKYTSGVSSPDGELFLATYTDPNKTTAFSELIEPLWIHRFNSEGELTHRYKLISGTEKSLNSIFDIDFENNRMYVVTSEGEVRVYPF